MPLTLPFATADLPGTGGQIRFTPEDFAVEEIPLYEPCGSGEHCYIRLRKTGRSTQEVLSAIGRFFGMPERDIGVAGHKDKHAVTVQTISVRGLSPADALRFESQGVEILQASLHTNKLRRGHLSGNRFRIRIRETRNPNAAPAILERLARLGIPNYFGEQRFGLVGSDRIGEALVKRNYAEAAELAGKSLKPGGDPREAFRRMPRRLVTLYLSAFQSRLFNEVLSTRIQDMHRLLPGDLAWLHDRGACFLVEDVSREQARADRFEISPSGPIFGTRTAAPTGEPGTIESSVRERAGIGPDDFKNVLPGFRLPGARRPLRVPLLDAVVETQGADLVLGFRLPSGSYATSLLRELMKSDSAVGALPEGDDN